jgi:hypothetical protein
VLSGRRRLFFLLLLLLLLLLLSLSVEPFAAVLHVAAVPATADRHLLVAVQTRPEEEKNNYQFFNVQINPQMFGKTLRQIRQYYVLEIVMNQVCWKERQK